MKKDKFLVFFITKNSYLALGLCLLTLVLLLIMHNYSIGLMFGTFILGLIFYLIKTRNTVRKDFAEYIEEISIDMEYAVKNSMLLLPIPIMVTGIEGNLIWKNSHFNDLLNEQITEKYIYNLIIENFPAYPLDKHNQDIDTSIQIEKKHFKVMGKMLEKFEGHEQRVLFLYLLEDTELHVLLEKYDNEKPIVGIIMVDNYDDLMQSLGDVKAPQMIAEVDAAISSWANVTGGILKKFDRDRYLLIFSKYFLKEFEDKKFEILDSIKEINLGNKIPVTISIGIDNSSHELAKSFQYALAALEIALGRGGDQAVVRNGDMIKYFGGKTRELEKRTRVKARVIAHALKEVISQSTDVMIMGHSNCDLDSLGSALGIYKISKSLGKKAHIVLNASNQTIEPFMERIQKISDYDNLFIKKAEALEMVHKKTLLIVVDTHRPIYTEFPDLLKHTGNIVIIDHHRRGAEFIQDTVLTYHEPYASSTCELVTEIIQYIGDTVKLETLDAELLYAGILVDTKGFTFKTGVRTFEAAAYLRKRGVDTTHVKQLLQNDLDSYIRILEIVKQVKIIRDNIAISVSPPEMKNSMLIAAQAADQILGITGIAAAFVITDTGNEICISGRSFGEVNVQVVLEKIGGGGHQTVAGAQFHRETLDVVLNKLKNAIEEHIRETTKE